MSVVIALRPCRGGIKRQEKKLRSSKFVLRPCRGATESALSYRRFHRKHNIHRPFMAKTKSLILKDVRMTRV